MEQRESFQEREYHVPYHWNWTPGTEIGRVYWFYLRRIRELLLQTGSRVHADIGCGDGRATAFLKETYIGSITGFDYSERAVQMARIIADAPGIEWQVWDVKTPPPVNGVFDSATLIEVVEHFPIADLPLVFQHVHALLKTGGSLVLCTPSVLDTCVPKKHYQHFTQQQLTSLLEVAGFRVTLVEGQDRHSAWFIQLYRLVDNRLWCIKPLAKWMNTVLYSRYVDRASLSEAYRFIIRAEAV